MERFCERISYYIAELNVIHPFREGNGRVLRILSNIIALKANFFIDYSLIKKEDYLDSMIQSVFNTTQLITTITNSIIKTNKSIQTTGGL